MKDDLISRQAAIDAANAVWSVTGDKNVAKVREQIKDLPSAQPEIIRCKDCKWYFRGGATCMYCGLPHGVRSKDDYCSDAERKEE